MNNTLVLIPLTGLLPFNSCKPLIQKCIPLLIVFENPSSKNVLPDSLYPQCGNPSEKKYISNTFT